MTKPYKTTHSTDSWCGVPGCPCGGKEAWEKRNPNVCGSCGSDLSTDEHDADCPFYSYGGEDGRDG